MRPEVALAILGLVVAVDCYATARIEATSTGLDAAMVIGLASGLVWIAALTETARRLERKQRGRVRAVLGWAVTITALAWTVCLASTLPRSGPSRVRTSLGMFTLSFAATAGVGLCLFGTWKLMRQRGVPEPVHSASSTAEVWHVHGRDLDYYVAHCECDWIGPSHDAQEPEALARATTDAHTHSRRVVPGVVDLAV